MKLTHFIENSIKNKNLNKMIQKLKKITKNVIVISGVLASSFWLYHYAQKQYYLKNIQFLNEKQVQDVLNSNNFKHEISLNSKPNKERVVIIGSGIIGITTAYYLLETHKFDVVLLEKNQVISQETSFKNGCLFCPALCEPWVNQNVYKYLYKALFYKNFNISIYFNSLRDYFPSIWILNMLPNTIPSRVNENRE